MVTSKFCERERLDCLGEIYNLCQAGQELKLILAPDWELGPYDLYYWIMDIYVYLNNVNVPNTLGLSASISYGNWFK